MSQKACTILLSEGDAQLVMAALGELPAKISRPTMNRLEAQLAAGQPEAPAGRQPKKAKADDQQG